MHNSQIYNIHHAQDQKHTRVRVTRETLAGVVKGVMHSAADAPAAARLGGVMKPEVHDELGAAFSQTQQRIHFSQLVDHNFQSSEK